MSEIPEIWKCPQCNSAMESDEIDEGKVFMAEKGGQFKFHCPECNEDLVADANAWGEGIFEIVEEWNY